MTSAYAHPPGGVPPQGTLPSDSAVFTQAYAFIPACVQREIVTSYLPGWQGMRAWVLARPLSGFAETFSQLAVELDPAGGSDQPEVDPKAQSVLFVTSGCLRLDLEGIPHPLKSGSYAYLPPGVPWSLWNAGKTEAATFQWVRKRYQAAPGLSPPEAFVVHETDVPAIGTDSLSQAWTTQRFVAPEDLRHDMHVNLVNFDPGGTITFAETHVMEHGIYVLHGSALYRLNQDWVAVTAGDFLWLRAFCPQACIASGPDRFRYLLYKDVNRHPNLGGYTALK